MNTYLVAPYMHDTLQKATIEDVYSYCRDKKSIAVDIETTPKEGYH